ncbi:hypothetical protein [Streptomyces sp. NPDC057293]|uniref:hypothetical protein n=1 Tax=unclassified Streptomyces TaxID=2593676 RepID=UPI0036332DAF
MPPLSVGVVTQLDTHPAVVPLAVAPEPQIIAEGGSALTPHDLRASPGTWGADRYRVMSAAHRLGCAVRHPNVALLLGGAVLAANLVHPPLKLFTSPVQFDTQVEPVPILADSGR